MEKETALISVIVPVHNGQDYLEGCIESIEKQTYQKLELVIVNDGSTDGTAACCLKLQKKYDNIRVLTLDDEGVSAARNAGMKTAQGEYLTFVDADDRLRPQTLEILYDCLTDTDSDISGCHFFIWKNEQEWKAGAEQDQTGDSGVIKGKTPGGRAQVYTPQDYVKDEILQGNSRCWSKLYRKEAVGTVRFREGLTIGEDMLFLIDVLPHVRRIAETEFQGYGYFQNPAGTINRRFSPRYMDQITCWELAREELLQRGAGREIHAQATALLLMGIMLTVGKIAYLPPSQRKAQKKYIDICHKKLEENRSVAGAYDRLSKGYRLKVRLFGLLPGLYLTLYGAKKRSV